MAGPVQNPGDDGIRSVLHLTGFNASETSV